jgi:hypothetical protein
MKTWKESGFSGDSYLIFDAPVTELRWQVSVNRYGKPRAQLFIMGRGGGPQGAEADLPVPEPAPDEVLASAAKAWAESVIEDGSLIRGLLLPPGPEVDDGEE